MFGDKLAATNGNYTSHACQVDLMLLLLFLPSCSRNARLSAESRANALSISKAIKWAEEARAAGQLKEPAGVVEEVKRQIIESGGSIDYVEVRATHQLGQA